MKLLIQIVLICSVAACTCNQPPAKPTLLTEGTPCTADDLCDTGLCDAAEGFAPVCVRKCSSTCKTDEVCEQLTKGRFACVPDRGGLCTACTADEDCPYPADKCIVVSGEKVCGRDCAFDQACPTSYQCVNAVGPDGKAKPQQCSPISGSCLCTASSAGQMVSCEQQNGFGKCVGHRTCDGLAGYGACDAKVPAAETCNGLDDDCDGQNDEGLGMTECGQGLCKRTVNACTAGNSTACVPGTPATEVCDGFDNDCDGVNDNGFDLTSNVNHCGMCNRTCVLANATPRCDVSTCKVDHCDTNYGNCDRIEANGCEVDTRGDVNNCSACGNKCMAPGATSSCVNSACTFVCNAGFIDLDNDPANGCEYACTFQSAIDEPDLQFVDANCDGIDGEWNNGIFVAPAVAGGNDTNPGTRTAPKATIAAGVTAAVSGSKRDVYVAAGAYNGQLNVSAISGKIIAGGYAPPTWRRSLINTTTVSGANPAVKVTNVDGGTLQFLTVQGSNPGGTGATAYGMWVVGSNNLKLEGLSVSAGDGTDGLDGPDGGVGAGAGNGNPGIRGCTNDPDLSFICAVCNAPGRGTGGTSSCGEPGGSGGLSGWTFNPPAGNGSSGLLGSGVTSGGGGIAPGSGSNIPGAFANGANGAPGTTGGNGNGASGLGTLLATGYVKPTAQSGVSGTDGKGGGGGGGAGGGCAKNILGDLFCVCFSYGSTGGGGGGGGCAGGVGNAGQSGGASIGLMVWSSTVIATNTSVQTGNGGSGGRGGNGGPGGLGGIGQGSAYDEGAQGTGGTGGRGGNGGNGGRSGNGGGGGGGAVIGVARNAGSTFTQNNVSFSLGVAGNGGPSAGNAGQNGANSQVQLF